MKCKRRKYNKKKSLIALMCAGVVAIAPLAISGCAD